MNFKIHTSPTEEELEQIKNWLISEKNTEGHSFICNWETAINRYRNKESKLFSFNIGNKVVGFVSYTEFKSEKCKTIEIDYFVIEQSYRNNGIGKAFYSKLDQKFRKLGFIVAKLFCMPQESENFWRKMGYIEFPREFYSETVTYKIHELSYYKPLIDIQFPNENIDDENVLKLWAKRPENVNENDDANWVWQINESGDLEKPIIFPRQPDWKICWKRNGTIVKDKKVKHFGNQVNVGGFFYITKLDE